MRTTNSTTGNLVTKGGLALQYNDAGHAHAVTNAGSNSYGYDANGNMTQRVVGGQTFTLGYDAENRLVSVSGAATASFLYDGDGRQVKAVVGTVTTYYVGSHYQVDNGVVTKYYLAGAQRVAMRQNGTLYYLLGDHLGSTSLTTNTSGGLVAELRYKAWGETRFTSGTMPTTYQFTSQRNESSIGLYFYNARWFDPLLGRFTSADTIVPGGVQGLDRYAYVNNSPVRYIDPSGHAVCPFSECDVVVHPKTGRMQLRGNLWNAAKSIMRDLGGKNDLEAMVSIIEAGAGAYRSFDRLLPQLSNIFLGVAKSGPGTLWDAAQMTKKDGCAGVGREPHDCEGAEYYFGDQGFHPDFQDGHNQLFHLWAYIAETAVPGNSLAGGFGTFIGTGANVQHEIIQSILRYPDDGWGTSWQDYELSGQGMYIGALITTGSITPSELADVVRNTVGTQGSGSGGEFQILNGLFGPLAGQLLP